MDKKPEPSQVTFAKAAAMARSPSPPSHKIFERDAQAPEEEQAVAGPSDSREKVNALSNKEKSRGSRGGSRVGSKRNSLKASSIRRNRNSVVESEEPSVMSLFRPQTIDVDGTLMSSPDKHMKYIFATGSMLSNSGKNTTTASIGKKLQDMGYVVTVIKIDNYLNVDFGLLSPIKFGEIFVFNDGTECHYDCGIYERYLNIELTWKHHLTLGKILDYVNLNERNGKFFGNVITMKNEQIIDIICQWLYNVAHLPIKKLHTGNNESNEPETPNVCILDFGGFVEDNESDLFMQAMKHFQRYYVDNRESCYLHLHFGYIIEQALDSANNKKRGMQVINQYSEAAEQSVKQHLLSRRLVPDILVLRFEGRSHNFGEYNNNIPRIQDSIIRKFHNLLVFGHSSHKFITNKMESAGLDGSGVSVPVSEMREKIIELPNLDTTYAIPEFLLQNTQIFETICEKFEWEMVDKSDMNANGGFWDVFDKMSMQGNQEESRMHADIFQELAMKVRSIEREVTIGLVGKYGTDDLTYLSLIEALKLSALSVNVQLNIKVIASDELETYQEKCEYLTYPQSDSSDNAVRTERTYDPTDFESTKFDFMLKDNTDRPDNKDEVEMMGSADAEKDLTEFSEQTYNEAWRNVFNVDGILVGGGFGVRGILGIISVIKYCREKNVPFFGICFGMQMTCVEYARNVLNLKDANSVEVNSDTKNPLVVPMDSHQKEMNKFGHTMRLGNCNVRLKKDSLAYEMYGKNDVIYERHRHGYEVNPLFFKKLEEKGLIVSGKDNNNKTCEIVELDPEIWKNHSYFIAAQYHPELIASAYKPNPLFTGLVKGCKERKFGSNAPRFMRVKSQQNASKSASQLRSQNSNRRLFRL